MKWVKRILLVALGGLLSLLPHSAAGRGGRRGATVFGAVARAFQSIMTFFTSLAA
jgi:hypothetical protein